MTFLDGPRSPTSSTSCNYCRPLVPRTQTIGPCRTPRIGTVPRRWLMTEDIRRCSRCQSQSIPKVSVGRASIIIIAYFDDASSEVGAICGPRSTRRRRVGSGTRIGQLSFWEYRSRDSCAGLRCFDSDAHRRIRESRYDAAGAKADASGQIAGGNDSKGVNKPWQ